MVEDQLVERGIKNLGVLEVMSRLPRHMFVPEYLGHKAYGQHPLPIGHHQTISQPYAQAVMTQALNLTGTERVLEIGTGSGYQTALLAELSAQVFTIERLKPLGQTAKVLLQKLGYTNINHRFCDGTYGWRNMGPYDAILFAAGAPEMPKALVDQLAMNGRLVGPVGPDGEQKLVMLTRTEAGIEKEELGDCNFVPLIGKFGHPSAPNRARG
ncbi:MAG: protein-L-isoaspartate(D-aspartate) O-methyltransferase [Candidatus Nitronauta litoralis]|uniref:Protein-L-isoaspartate O-methyltransferase n=1 Tax=Candidatus Nitronauta litoralis TaxID=2705533 RepID=A0A7T0G224_9BACT|nr:MAG: protein-L-isoaspartate(D-aspartate) O-methyltransferase [Candidatus Nitronauta litoralis]